MSIFRGLSLFIIIGVVRIYHGVLNFQLPIFNYQSIFNDLIFKLFENWKLKINKLLAQPAIFYYDKYMPRRTTTWYYVYILISFKDNLFYVGYTNNLQKRIREHNQGEVFSTKSRRPLKLVYVEACLNEEDAKQREKYFKTGIGKKFLRHRLQNYLHPQNSTKLSYGV